MLTANQVMDAANIAAAVVEKICLDGGPMRTRNPEQISLIVELINTAIDPILSLYVSSVEDAAHQKSPECRRELCGNPGKLEVSVMHNGNIETFRTIQDAFKFIAESMKGGAKNG